MAMCVWYKPQNDIVLHRVINIQNSVLTSDRDVAL